MQIPDVASLFTLTGAIDLIIGAMLCRGYYWVADKRLDRAHPENAPHSRKWKSVIMAWTIGAIVVGYMFVETHEAYSLNRANADELKSVVAQNAECQHEFVTAIQTRALFGDTSDDLGLQQRVLFLKAEILHSNLISGMFNPPPDVAALPESDPRRAQFKEDAIRDYLSQIPGIEAQIQTLQDQQRSNLKIRNDTPLTCGR